MLKSDRLLIRRAFNSAAKTYDIAADWQKAIAQYFLDYFDRLKPRHQVILDVGSGTGFLLKQLSNIHVNNRFIALDIAEQMLQFSRQRLSIDDFICSEAENLSLADNSVHIIVSNIVLHWCHSLKQALKEQYRVLVKGGLLLFSILGEDSLRALREAWCSIDNDVHVNAFPEEALVKNTCQSVGFSLLSFKRCEIKKHYKNVYELMRHLKASGANGIIARQNKGLTGKQKIALLNKRYRNPLCYQVFLIACRK